MVRVRNGYTTSEPFRERLAEESLQVHETKIYMGASRIRWVAPMQQHSYEKVVFPPSLQCGRGCGSPMVRPVGERKTSRVVPREQEISGSRPLKMMNEEG
jgi:hypothetical protein